MPRLVAFVLAGFLHLQSTFALADDAAKQLVGSWRLSSWVIQIVGGEASEPFGPNPNGRAVFTADGHVAYIIAASNRKPASNNEESAALLKSLLAYTGKFTIDGEKLITKVDISWNELMTGSDTVRFYKLEGDRLSLRTPEQVSAVYVGKKVVGTLIWERER
jgi:hypothetical protein